LFTVLSKGILNLNVVKAELIRDTELLGSMSPYCTLTHKGSKLKTKVQSSAGKLPVWNDEFQFNIEDPSEEIFLRVWDQDLLTSDAVGFVKVKASSLMLNNHVEDWFTIYYENQNAGKVLLIADFAPEGGDQFQQL
jgi:Ca2+-dependent lipid-binding protein